MFTYCCNVFCTTSVNALLFQNRKTAVIWGESASESSRFSWSGGGGVGRPAGLNAGLPVWAPRCASLCAVFAVPEHPLTNCFFVCSPGSGRGVEINIWGAVRRRLSLCLRRVFCYGQPCRPADQVVEGAQPQPLWKFFTVHNQEKKKQARKFLCFFFFAFFFHWSATLGESTILFLLAAKCQPQRAWGEKKKKPIPASACPAERESEWAVWNFAQRYLLHAQPRDKTKKNNQKKKKINK